MTPTGLFNSEGRELSLEEVVNNYLSPNIITRVEVIDHIPAPVIKGRAYTHYDPSSKVELQLQDYGQTLKVFLSYAEHRNDVK
jgi:hypothetical protein